MGWLQLDPMIELSPQFSPLITTYRAKVSFENILITIAGKAVNCQSEVRLDGKFGPSRSVSLFVSFCSFFLTFFLLFLTYTSLVQLLHLLSHIFLPNSLLKQVFYFLLLSSSKSIYCQLHLFQLYMSSYSVLSLGNSI